jgi:hypothetical protein
MKNITGALAASAMFLLLASAPTLAQTFYEQSQDERDECLLYSKNCPNAVDDIFQRMHRLDKEIRKGARVYTPDELRHLQEKLQDVNDMLYRLTAEGG